jgi:hypothetical protein
MSTTHHGPAHPPRRRAVKPGPRCSVCAHPSRAAIDQALVEGISAPKVAARYRRLSDDAIRRHAAAHVPAALAAAAADGYGQRAGETLAQLNRCLERVNLLFDACDRWLRDPDDPTRYDIGPRAEDLHVTYVEPDGDGKPVRKKAKLSELLARLDGIAPEIRMVETKHADPRELVLHTAKRLEAQTELLARIIGQLKDPAVLNLTVHVEWIQLRAVILRALDPHPEARLAVAQALEAERVGH